MYHVLTATIVVIQNEQERNQWIPGYKIQRFIEGDLERQISLRFSFETESTFLLNTSFWIYFHHSFLSELRGASCSV